MKTIRISFLIFLLTFISCSKDDDNEQGVIDPNVDITGEWNLTDYKIDDGKMTMTFDEGSISGQFSAYGKDYDYAVAFSKDPDIVTSAGSFTLVFTSSFLGVSDTQEILVDTSDLEDEVLNGPWAIEGNNFITEEEGIEVTYQLMELTENKIRFRIDLTQADVLVPVEELEDLGALDIDLSGKLNVTLER
ncbi:hypothetical protein [Abyssalbus ytuae]|uniref:Lipocalin-like domain-containing protein n=1 Tax=Abyssalbus ytuae TaxID=2926907 RepID=A0A9E6ZVH4_9FLAO|nr:hypothetical protein [Abyssalbus ytuae]UOB15982.1 hypothetical protein MQE35_09540 [Abyssalbus ytuae]